MSNDNQGDNYICGIDIGTSNVRCIIASRPTQPGQLPDVVGYGSSPAMGMRKGVITDSVAVAQSIDAALAAAEKMSGARADSAIFSINGDHISTLQTKGVVAIPPGLEISYEDTQKAMEAASILQLPQNQEILDLIPVEYSIDGQPAIKDPVGMSGSRLELHGLAVVSSSYALRLVRKSIEIANLRCLGIQPAVRASAEAVLTTTQKERGCIVIDMGSQTTGVAVFEESEPTKLTTIPMGSSSITNDLAIGLRVGFDLAEEVKIKHLNPAGQAPDGEYGGLIELEQDGELIKFRVRDVNLIVSSRVEEILEKVAKELKKLGQHSRLPGGVVLCGQGSKFPGLVNTAKDILSLPVKLADLSAYKTSTGDVLGAEWASALGLILLDPALGHGGGSHESMAGSIRDYLGGALKRFTKKH